MLTSYRSTEFFARSLTVAAGTRPTQDGAGTSVTPAQNTLGSYAEVLSDLAGDCYGLLIHASAVGINTVSRTCLISIGVDTAGGTSYAESFKLAVSGAARMYINGCGPGVSYYIPVFIPAGAAVAVAAQVNTADVTAFRVQVQALRQPSRSDGARVGAWVEALGHDLANSRGTALTPGTTADGAWVNLGTATKNAWGLEFHFAPHDDTTSSGVYTVDLAIGDATNKRLAVHQFLIPTASTEHTVKPVGFCYANVAEGDKVYMRAQSATALDDAYYGSAYLIGG